VRDRRQALDVHVEQPAEGRGLGVAQLRELRSDVPDGAVVLAELDARAVRGAGRGVAFGGQRGGQRSRPVRRGGRRELRGVPRLELGDPRLGEALDAPRPAASARKRSAPAARSSYAAGPPAWPASVSA
jgi:hypothetical protein